MKGTRDLGLGTRESVAYAIEADGLTKWFGKKRAVEDLTIRIPRGSVFAFLGRNGSGKTTTLLMLLGFVRPTSGSSRVLGHDSRKISPALRGRIGFMAESHPLHEWMTVEQEARFAAAFYASWNWALFNSIVDHFGLDRKTKGSTLSRGQRAGLSLALTLAPEPELLILDDPAMGLDPVARRAMLQQVLKATRESGRTVLFSSHQLDDVELVADHAAILDDSTLKVTGSIEDLTAAMRQLYVTFAPGTMPATLPTIHGLLSTQVSGDTMILTVIEPNDATRAAIATLGPISVREQPVSFSHAVISYLSPGVASVPHREKAVALAAEGF